MVPVTMLLVGKRFATKRGTPHNEREIRKLHTTHSAPGPGLAPLVHSLLARAHATALTAVPALDGVLLSEQSF